MQFKTIALATTSLVAAYLAVAPAHAASSMMGDVSLGFAPNWEESDFGGEGTFDNDYSSVLGRGRVNVPYSDTVNVQLDVVGRTSLDTNDDVFGGKSIGFGHFGIGGHINYRDDQGLLGVFGGAGRVHDFFGSAVFLAGIEGQYYCGPWTFRGQLAYLDSDSQDFFLLKNAGVARAGVSYYMGKQWKFTGDLAYIDGEQGFFEQDASQWAWGVGAHYWFGKSVPVSAFVEYRGRHAEVADFGDPDNELDAHTFNLGLTFHFGGDGFEDADRNGASVDLPDMEWYRLPTFSSPP
jgi:hypothetical protein